MAIMNKVQIDKMRRQADVRRAKAAQADRDTAIAQMTAILSARETLADTPDAAAKQVAADDAARTKLARERMIIVGTNAFTFGWVLFSTLWIAWRAYGHGHNLTGVLPSALWLGFYTAVALMAIYPWRATRRRLLSLIAVWAADVFVAIYAYIWGTHEATSWWYLEFPIVMIALVVAVFARRQRKRNPYHEVERVKVEDSWKQVVAFLTLIGTLAAVFAGLMVVATIPDGIGIAIARANVPAIPFDATDTSAIQALPCGRIGPDLQAIKKAHGDQNINALKSFNLVQKVKDGTRVVNVDYSQNVISSLETREKFCH